MISPNLIVQLLFRGWAIFFFKQHCGSIRFAHAPNSFAKLNKFKNFLGHTETFLTRRVRKVPDKKFAQVHNKFINDFVATCRQHLSEIMSRHVNINRLSLATANRFYF